MIPAKPKQTITAIAVMLFLIVVVIGCNNSADNSKTATDSSSKMGTDTIKKVDTSKMDTASTRPVKTT
jgi:uncharacterized lipoprotein NlpE involved in copper resistance